MDSGPEWFSGSALSANETHKNHKMMDGVRWIQTSLTGVGEFLEVRICSLADTSSTWIRSKEALTTSCYLRDVDSVAHEELLVCTHGHSSI